MKLSDVEAARCSIDQGYDGFFDFIEVGRIGNQRIVRRESCKWLGIIDEFDNILLPLIYDKLTPKGYGVETIIANEDCELCGLYGTNDKKIIFPAIYDAIYPVLNKFWCMRNRQWKLMTSECETIWHLPSNTLPLDHDKYVCILRKTDNNLRIEVLDDKYNHSQRRLRDVAHGSDIQNRIKITSRYCNLILYSDIYGNVIYSNININDIIL